MINRYKLVSGGSISSFCGLAEALIALRITSASDRMASVLDALTYASYSFENGRMVRKKDSLWMFSLYTVLLAAGLVVFLLVALHFSSKHDSFKDHVVVALPAGVLLAVHAMSGLAAHGLHIKVRKWYLLACLAVLVVACTASAIMAHL